MANAPEWYIKDFQAIFIEDKNWKAFSVGFGKLKSVNIEQFLLDILSKGFECHVLELSVEEYKGGINSILFNQGILAVCYFSKLYSLLRELWKNVVS